jgi:hypothetical protein
MLPGVGAMTAQRHQDHKTNTVKQWNADDQARQSHGDGQ